MTIYSGTCKGEFRNWHWHFSLSWQSSVQSQHTRNSTFVFISTPFPGMRLVVYLTKGGSLRSNESTEKTRAFPLPSVISNKTKEINRNYFKQYKDELSSSEE